MTFLFGLLTGILVTFALAGIACIFITDERDDELQEMQEWYNQNYRKDD